MAFTFVVSVTPDELLGLILVQILRELLNFLQLRPRIHITISIFLSNIILTMVSIVNLGSLIECVDILLIIIICFVIWNRSVMLNLLAIESIKMTIFIKHKNHINRWFFASVKNLLFVESRVLYCVLINLRSLVWVVVECRILRRWIILALRAPIRILTPLPCLFVNYRRLLYWNLHIKLIQLLVYVIYTFWQLLERESLVILSKAID